LDVLVHYTGLYDHSRIARVAGDFRVNRVADRYVHPMPQPVRTVIIVIAVLFLILWLMNGVGVLGPLNAPLRVR
jgi:hypothetical protein